MSSISAISGLGASGRQHRRHGRTVSSNGCALLFLLVFVGASVTGLLAYVSYIAQLPSMPQDTASRGGAAVGQRQLKARHATYTSSAAPLVYSPAIPLPTLPPAAPYDDPNEPVDAVWTWVTDDARKEGSQIGPTGRAIMMVCHQWPGYGQSLKW